MHSPRIRLSFPLASLFRMLISVLQQVALARAAFGARNADYIKYEQHCTQQVASLRKKVGLKRRPPKAGADFDVRPVNAVDTAKLDVRCVLDTTPCSPGDVGQYLNRMIPQTPIYPSLGRREMLGKGAVDQGFYDINGQCGEEASNRPEIV